MAEWLDSEKFAAARMDGVCVVNVDCELDESTVKEFRALMVHLKREGDVRVVLMMSGMKFMSYLGVGVLVERLRQFRAAGGDIKLAGVNLYTRRLFRMTGVESLFDIHDTVGAAIAAFDEQGDAA